jgi:hypothetical protein
VNDHFIAAFPITPENKEALLDLVLETYVGLACIVCGHVYNSVADLKERNPKWAAEKGEERKLACPPCYDQIERVDA